MKLKKLRAVLAPCGEEYDEWEVWLSPTDILVHMQPDEKPWDDPALSFEKRLMTLHESLGTPPGFLWSTDLVIKMIERPMSDAYITEVLSYAISPHLPYVPPLTKEYQADLDQRVKEWVAQVRAKINATREENQP